MMTFTSDSTHVTVATNQDHDFRERAMAPGSVPLLELIIELDGMLPLKCERMAVARPVLQVLTVPVEVPSHFPFGGVIVVPPWLTP